MLAASFAVLSVAVAFGVVLAVMNAQTAGTTKSPPWLLRTAHGVLGGAGLVALLLALRGPRRGVAAGAGQFGLDASVLLGAALTIGLAIAALSRRRRPPGFVIVLHLVVAIFGYVILAAYVSLG